MPGTSGSAYGYSVLPELGKKSHHTLDSHHLESFSLPQLWEHFLWESVVCPPAHSCHPGVGELGRALLILCVPHLQALEQHSFLPEADSAIHKWASSLLTHFSLLGLKTSPWAWLRVRTLPPPPHPLPSLSFSYPSIPFGPNKLVSHQRRCKPKSSCRQAPAGVTSLPVVSPDPVGTTQERALGLGPGV